MVPGRPKTVIMYHGQEVWDNRVTQGAGQMLYLEQVLAAFEASLYLYLYIDIYI